MMILAQNVATFANVTLCLIDAHVTMVIAYNLIALKLWGKFVSALTLCALSRISTNVASVLAIKAH